MAKPTIRQQLDNWIWNYRESTYTLEKDIANRVYHEEISI